MADQSGRTVFRDRVSLRPERRRMGFSSDRRRVSDDRPVRLVERDSRRARCCRRGDRLSFRESAEAGHQGGKTAWIPVSDVAFPPPMIHPVRSRDRIRSRQDQPE